jgi:hypothetical protein
LASGRRSTIFKTGSAVPFMRTSEVKRTQSEWISTDMSLGCI